MYLFQSSLLLIEHSDSSDFVSVAETLLVLFFQNSSQGLLSCDGV